MQAAGCWPGRPGLDLGPRTLVASSLPHPVSRTISQTPPPSPSSILLALSFVGTATTQFHVSHPLLEHLLDLDIPVFVPPLDADMPAGTLPFVARVPLAHCPVGTFLISAPWSLESLNADSLSPSWLHLLPRGAALLSLSSQHPQFPWVEGTWLFPTSAGQICNQEPIHRPLSLPHLAGRCRWRNRRAWRLASRLS